MAGAGGRPAPVAAELQGGGHFNRAIQGPRHQPASKSCPPGGRRDGPAQGGGLAKPGVVAGSERDRAGDQRCGQRRTPREGPQQTKHTVRVDGACVHGEGHADDRDSRRENGSLGKRLRADVGRAEQRQNEAVNENRVAPLGGEAVDQHQDDREARGPPQRKSQSATRAREEADGGNRCRAAREDDRVRRQERNRCGRRAEEACGQRAAVAERPRAVAICERRPHCVPSEL